MKPILISAEKLTRPPSFFATWWGEMFIGLATGLIVAYGFVWIADNWGK